MPAGSSCFERFVSKKGWTLQYQHPHHFTRSQWSTSITGWYCLYRVTVAIYFIAWLFLNMFDVLSDTPFSWDTLGYWFIKLTHWGFALLTLDTILQASLTLHGYYVKLKSKKKYPTDMSILIRLSWIIENCTNVIALTITLVYWTVLYKGKTDDLLMNFHVHAYNSIYVVINLFLTHRPVRLKHFYHPLLFGIFYLLFGIFYYAARGTDEHGNRYIYNIIDWGNPGPTLMYVVGIFFVILIIHMFVYTLHWLRLKLHRCCSKDMLDGGLPVSATLKGNINTEFVDDENNTYTMKRKLTV